MKGGLATGDYNVDTFLEEYQKINVFEDKNLFFTDYEYLWWYNR